MPRPNILQNLFKSIKGGKEMDRNALRFAAAGVLMQAPKLAVDLAGVSTDKFVASSRKAYKAEGFGFTDSDIREIHRLLRVMVLKHQEEAARRLQGNVPQPAAVM